MPRLRDRQSNTVSRKVDYLNVAGRTLSCLAGYIAIEKSVFTPEYQIFLKHLRLTRERQGLTQTQLAEILEETQSTISKCERGEKRLDIVEVVAFCRAMEVPFSQFAAELEALIAGERGG